ncbi:leucine--tRNA ligase [Candidatus Peregrinibacteria bacterium RIFOXYC2_FULL_41_22]|nr:MAG: leucine--tRNA ligase [Candidatus Peregrinibacteria bacterium RIFOXYC2_FULL_41_22]
MLKHYDHSKAETKWRKFWEAKKLYKTDLQDSTKPKYYNLVMFPYPSGDKLHIGHWYSYAPADSWGRYMRMKGFNVFQPIGFDAFGLPAENYAIKTGVHPAQTTKTNIAYMRKQLKAMGAFWDWDAEVVTAEPDYYKWTQWVFLQLYKNGLVYRKTAPVNWCPSCKTVLANEQAQDGLCDRCDSEVTKKDLTQWFVNIKQYAQKLLDYKGLDWPEKTRLMQENWIGRSEGSEVDFEIQGYDKKITVYTTRIDTLYGATYMVLAPEHELIEKITTIENKKSVENYIKKTRKATDIERSAEDREKTGVFTGAYATNPVNGAKIPIWIADYVLVHYGTGAVMAVPAHDTRDFAFAKKYKLPIKEVISPINNSIKSTLPKAAFVDDGKLINSSEFGGTPSAQARLDITRFLDKKGLAKLKINYRLRDWLISRQRYWGAPIPIVYCDKCGEVAVAEKDLPVKLPMDIDFTPKGDGKSPLNTSKKFVTTKCPTCGGPATRETDTMDTFVCSSWYFLRYPCSQLDKKPFEEKTLSHWLPVDMYIGGPEHACMHLLYARFIHKAMHDLGYVKASEPFKRLVHQGMITKNGAKMSKSKGNVVSPDEFVKMYGSDVFRMYLMFMGPFTQGGDWNDKGIVGIKRFVEKFWRAMMEEVKDGEKIAPAIIHKTVKKVTEDIDAMHFNTAISALMALANEASGKVLSKDQKQVATRLIAPLAPHLAEEIWSKVGGKGSVFEESWPTYDSAQIVDDEITIAIQVNGRLRGTILIPKDLGKEAVLARAKAEENVKKYLAGQVVKEIYVPGKIVNLVVK